MWVTELWVGVVLICLIVLATTANLAIRQFSRVRLSELLEKKGRREVAGQSHAVP